jgi:cell wall-associated NlpC family hydrolase
VSPELAAGLAEAVTAAASYATYAVYVVRWGDTLGGIARRFCGRTSAYPALARASGITNPNLIYAGRTRVNLAGCTSAASAAQAPRSSSARAARIATVISYARGQVGKWYRWGTAGPNTFDCSGLTMAAYARVGVRLSHASQVQRTQGRAVSLAHLLPGDVLWQPGHVVMYIGGGLVVEAPHQGARVRIRAFRAGEWSGARRMIV